MLFVLQLSFFISAAALTFGIAKKSWVFLLVSTITFLPIAYYYFFGVNNAWRYVGLIPVVLLLLTLVFWQLNKKRRFV